MLCQSKKILLKIGEVLSVYKSFYFSTTAEESEKILMKKIQNWFLKLPLSIPQKFIGVFVVLCLIPMLIITEIANQNYRWSLENSAENYVIQVSEEIVERIDESILEMQAITMTPYLENSAAHVLMGNDYLNTLEAVNAQFRLMKSGRNSNNIYIFDSNGQVFGSMPYKSRRVNIENQYEHFKNLAYEANGRVVMQEMLKIPDNSGQVHNYITLVRSIKELDRYRQVGVVVVDTDIKLFDAPIQTLNENTGGTTCIVDGFGRIIYDSDDEKIGSQLALKPPALSDGGGIVSWEAAADGEDSLCFVSGFQQSDWRMVVTIPKAVLFQEANNTIRLIRSITFPAMILAIIFFVLLSLNITRPLKKLVLLLDEVQQENFDVQFHVKYNDEVAKVGRSFNFMVRKIRQLIKVVYATKLLYKQTELDALQSQINPHFIYNTLETISMYSVIHHVPEIYDFTQTFGQILRYSIRDINLPVTLRQELDHVKNYVDLLECRFPGKYKLEINVPQTLEKLQMLKLTLQPLVENSIGHGLEDLENGGTITISAFESEEKMIVISVKDNGVGIPAEKLKEIQDHLLHSESLEEAEHIGLLNISRRLTLYYGEAASLTLESEENKGTEVSIRFFSQL